MVTATTWTQDAPYEGAQNLYERLTAALGGTPPSYHAAQAYAGLLTAADALSRADDATPAAVLAALDATDIAETAYGPITFRRLRRLSKSKPSDDARTAGPRRRVRHGLSRRGGNYRVVLSDARLERALSSSGSLQLTTFFTQRFSQRF